MSSEGTGIFLLGSLTRCLTPSITMCVPLCRKKSRISLIATRKEMVMMDVMTAATLTWESLLKNSM